MTVRDPRDWMWDEACALMERAARMQRQFFQPAPSSSSPGWEPPIEVEGNDVVISGFRQLPAVTRNTAIHRLEIPHGRFERRIRLSTAAFAVAQFELERGCLMLRLEKHP
jgi:HSP20 family protein